MIINKGMIHTNKGIEKWSHLSSFIPINIPTPILTKNWAPMPAYVISSVLVSFFDFKLIFFTCRVAMHCVSTALDHVKCC